MAYRLRPASTADEPAIWKATFETVSADVPADEKDGLDPRAWEAEFREYARDFVEGRRGERFVAEDEAGRFLGYMILGGLRASFYPVSVGFVYDLWVAPEHRQKGVARFLLREAERWAKTRGYRKMKLEVAVTNRPARDLYESAGYRVERMYMGKPAG
jgi:ribosomal protein S18 acetylase RimI-like enzyme